MARAVFSRSVPACTAWPGLLDRLPIQFSNNFPACACPVTRKPALLPLRSTDGGRMIVDLNGSVFDFLGEVGGAFYNLLSEQEHQVTMLLKKGVMWDHNSTFCEGVGIRYRSHAIVIEMGTDDNLLVHLDGKRLHMARGELVQEHVLDIEGSGELMLLLQEHRPVMGQACEVTTDALQVVVYITPAGTVNEAGVVQPAYLNFGIDLLRVPAHGIEGIISRSYFRGASKGKSSASGARRILSFKGNKEEFRMDSFFSTDHMHNAFGKS